MIIVCPQCGEREDTSMVCGMCRETLFGQELEEAMQDGCLHERIADCEDCSLPRDAHYYNIHGDRVEF